MHKILIVEDVEVVADLQILMWIRAGIAFEARRVETAEDFTRQIGLAVPDAILYSASMPQFSGFVALAKAKACAPIRRSFSSPERTAKRPPTKRASARRSI